MSDADETTTHPAIAAANALREFTAATSLGQLGNIRFSDTVTVTAMGLFGSIVGELEMHQLGVPDQREHFAEQLVQVIFRDWKPTGA